MNLNELVFEDAYLLSQKIRNNLPLFLYYSKNDKNKPFVAIDPDVLAAALKRSVDYKIKETIAAAFSSTVENIFPTEYEEVINEVR